MIAHSPSSKQPSSRPRQPAAPPKTRTADANESEFGHLLADESRPPPDEQVETSLRAETLARLLDTLAPRERRILEMRFGLNGEHPRTLDEVSRTFNVSRERIRQIENHALKKLSALADARSLSQPTEQAF